MTDRQIIEAELKYTEAEAARAFEWLRSKALDTNAGARCAAIMLAEVAKLKERDRYVQTRDSIIEECAKAIESAPLTYAGGEPHVVSDLRYLIVCAIRDLKSE